MPVPVRLHTVVLWALWEHQYTNMLDTEPKQGLGIKLNTVDNSLIFWINDVLKC